MALIGKLEADLEINAPAAAFYNVWKSQCHHLPNATPSNMQAVEVHEEGRSESYKERIEVDDETMTVGLVGIGRRCVQELQELEAHHSSYSKREWKLAETDFRI
ncbi:hypothetical protein Patl1_15436 [Pistacia atlantica]|uniref:Uncharacterized protein n=1 Tax=Pistacia atlantica TaxID=434234 RepID=A0ACC1B617_9ROSI|nr:hypothetical protein Patl1_15436 [Pistacia atlantica]